METKSRKKSETALKNENDLKPSIPTEVHAPNNTGSQTNGMAIASMVLGISGYFFCAFGGIGSLVGLILGIVALNQLNKNPNQEGKGMAVAGVVLNALSLLGIIIFILIYGAVIIATIAASACGSAAQKHAADYFRSSA